MNLINENLSKGIVLFIGYGIENHPGEYSDRVLATFEKNDQKTLSEVQKVFAELDQLKPD